MGGEEGATEGRLVYLVRMKSTCSNSTCQLLTGMGDLSTATIGDAEVENEGGAGGGRRLKVSHCRLDMGGQTGGVCREDLYLNI